MRVFLLPAAGENARSLEIQGPDFHYLAHVLRRRTGDRFQAADAKGNLWECRIARLGSDRLRLELERVLAPADASQEPRIRLIQALPKGRKMDQIVRQAVEAGVEEIWPVFSRHSLPRIGDSDERSGRRQRWLRIARQAVQQSGGGRLPDVGEPGALEPALEHEPVDGEVRLIFHPEPLEARALHSALAGTPSRVTLLIGPEGGFAAEEVELARSRGFTPIRIGKRVWRTETAALFAVAAVRTLIEERAAWKPV